MATIVDGSRTVGDKTIYYLGGRIVSQRKYEKRYPPPKCDGVPMCAPCGNWPVVSTLSVACDPSQISEMRARNKANGVNVDYNSQGHAIIPDADAYRRLRRLEGVRDRDSYSE